MTPIEDRPPEYEPLYPPLAEPPDARGPVLASVLRHWYLVLLPMVLLAAAAVVIGLSREPTYTAESRLNVGGFNISSQSIPGYAGGAYLLTNAYSRAVYGDPVLEPVGQQVGRSPRELSGMISASPVEDSPTIRLEVESKDPNEALEIANLTADRLQRHAITLARSNPDTRRLFIRFKETSREFAAAQRRAERARKARRGVTPAETALELARLRKDSVAALYQTSLGGQATTNAVQLLSPARTAESDRDTVLERLLAAALLGGFAIGVALAYLRGRNRVPRRIPS